MSVDQLPPGKARSASHEAQLVRYEEYIDKQIQATRHMVKAVDVMTALLTMTVGALAFLLTAAIVEHWLVPGGYNVAVRLLLFTVLVGGLCLYATRRLWPLCVGKINPAYAAQAIEHDNPSLKNSLLNLLLFREHREVITDAVYETLEQQAAQRLTRVPIDSAVDRTHLLRLGYVLMAIVAAAAFYKIFSPKDPFVTTKRVLMPWASVVAASRVSIDNVTPGSTTLARGDVLTISADVRGIGDDDPVVIRYTTDDGQAVDRPVPMTPSAAGLRFSGQIPPTVDGAKAGVAQNLRYRIEAGDARSLNYALTVVAAPTITIERIDYDYPEYTGYADRTIERLGDIRAIEGTKVTLHARANQPIEEAFVDFEADGRRDIVLNVTGNEARTAFELTLRDDRQTSKFTSYVLRFTSTDGRPNRDPVKFPIDVLPDNAPEVAILAPKEKIRDVRLDETVALEVEARDPDFGLDEIKLHGEVAGRPVIDVKLLTQNHTGRFAGKHFFTPSEHELKPGDMVRYWVTARDHRPNETVSDSQTLRITSPDPQHPPKDRLAQRDKREPQNKEQQEGGEQQGESGESGGESGSSKGDQQDESASEGGESGQPSEQNSAEQQGEQQGEKSSDQSGAQSNDSQSGGEQGTDSEGTDQQNSGQQNSEQQGEGQASPNDQSGKSGQSQQQSGGTSSPDSGNESSEGESQQPAGAGNAGNKPSDPNDSKNQSSENGTGGQSRKNSADKNEPQPGEPSSPVSSDGDNDGEAFERIQDFMKREGKLPSEGEEQPKEESNAESSDAEEGESASANGEQTNENNRGEQDNNRDTTKNTESGSSDKESDQTKPDSKSDASAQGENADTETKPGESQAGSRGETKEPAGQDNQSKSETPNGQQTSSQGESGAGDQPQESQGAPEPQQGKKPADKWEQKPSGDKPGENGEPPSGSPGQRKSDSPGEQGGDRTGDGEEGSGQKSDRDGTGSSGQNQSADEGAGESSEQGTGNNSPNAGQDATSDKPTGQSGSQEASDGSAARNGEGNEPGGTEKQPQSDPQNGTGNEQSQSNQQAQPGEQSKQNNEGDPATTNQPQSQNNSDPPNDEPNQQDESANQQPGQNSNGSATNGAGRVPNGAAPPSKSTGTAPEADAANLEYARKQTDLVLESLADQIKRQKVDKRLLDELGWSEADLQRFLARWQQLKAAAGDETAATDEAKRELDDALRSLGLRNGPLQQAKVSDDDNRNLRQGYHGAVPLEYQERLRAYNQGVSRARQSDE